jgi:hypothetical protein
LGQWTIGPLPCPSPHYSFLRGQGQVGEKIAIVATAALDYVNVDTLCVSKRICNACFGTRTLSTCTSWEIKECSTAPVRAPLTASAKREKSAEGCCGGRTVAWMLQQLRAALQADSEREARRCCGCPQKRCRRFLPPMASAHVICAPSTSEMANVLF